ncbi:alanine dehydrogenase [Paenibacillus barcinonensis]|uniref:Alanine dehydrogenase n=1 Tax=Paenibacillus barcinonensis TaxID=198119 RepID=A0A2V4UYX1_PAEBA|nr:alanine dehydrogenase [Paenibacillus barcinonensis]PYE45427.1 L-alanine dehydrogenase [Paenibacillus barcinonensis]QKS55243.1 alanine dehydrogenase [Paenibacillus barcinonensis]
MKIGVPKEIKNNENRVAITPAGVLEFVQAGHKVILQEGAGEGSGFPDALYSEAGAILVQRAESVWGSADMIMKVKEPLPEEYVYFRKGLILFTYLHLAAEPHLAKALVDSGVTAIAYETVNVNGSLPLLVPMSEIAGRMSAQKGAEILEKPNGGLGILLSGIPGVQRGKVTVLGGGIVGTNAARVALGLGANVTILDLNATRLRQLDDLFGNSVQTLVSTPSNISAAVQEADLLICAVLIPGAKAPRLVTEDMVKGMKAGSVIVDVAIDQGGVVETIDHITTHDNPTYIKHGVVHYAVANMPGAVPQTATLGLTNATLPYALQLANHGLYQAIESNPGLKYGVNVFNGKVTYGTVARDLGYDYIEVSEALLAEAAVL